MIKISIVCLIYRSVEWLEFVKHGIEKNTPKELDWELIFIANDATQEVLDYLKNNNIKHIVHNNPDPKEYYINRVYRAWNRAGEVDGEYIVFMNSDMFPAKGWLENLMKQAETMVPTSLLVESGNLTSTLPHTISKDFGRTAQDFQEREFEEYAEKIKEDKIEKYGTFMPLLIRKSDFIKSGGYPIGNMQGISGDQIFFYQVLEKMGLHHVTVFDSIVYHVQRGE